MIRGVTLRDRSFSSEVAERVDVDSIGELLRRQRLRWFGHVLRRGEDLEVGKVLTMEVAGAQGRRRPVRR